MTGEVIKSFLVGLGFEVDESSLSQFNKSINSATLRVTALYGSIKVAAAGIVYGISKISEGFEQLGYEYKILAPAINKTIMLRQEMLRAYSAAGVNLRKVIQDSVKLNISLTKTKYAFDAIYKSVASRFFTLLTKQSDTFRQKLYANMPKIQAALERFIKFIFAAFDATVTLGERLWSILGRVYDFFVKLDQATNGWSTVILGIVAAWKALNLSFLATPIGMVLAGLTAILALYDDFKTFQEGGQSLFNWAPAIPVINMVTDALRSMWKVLQGISDSIGNIILTFYQLAHGDGSGFIQSLKDAGSSFKNIFLKNPNAQQNLENSNGGIPYVSPLGGASNNSQTNLNLNQQTNINVQGVANAAAVGAVTATETAKANYNLQRNMKGSLRPGAPIK